MSLHVGCGIIISPPTTHVGHSAAQRLPLASHLVKVGGYMKKKTLAILSMAILPGAILLNSCGPEASSQDVILDEASSSWGPMYVYRGGALSEYSYCNDGWDNDGNGLRDAEDPGCHMGPGPLRDTSLYAFPQGHNFFPDITKDIPGGPGYGGEFRDPALITRWLRYLTQIDGGVAGIDLLSPGVNIGLVPFPEPTVTRQEQGTRAQGNNNNLFWPAISDIYLDNSFMPPEAGGYNMPLVAAPAVGPADPVQASQPHAFPYLDFAQMGPTWGPGYLFKGGSQGAYRRADLPNQLFW